MSNSELMDCKPSASKPGTEVGAGAPHPALCAVGALVPGYKGGWCLVRPIPYSPLGFFYGNGYLCRHPDIQRIIARTQARISSSQTLKRQPRRHKD